MSFSGNARHVRNGWTKKTYAIIPQTLEVREMKVRVDIRGFRVQQLVVVTTLTDAKRYPKSEVAGLFRQCWHAELDLRNIKISLQMDDLRGQSPEMVRREIWVHWLAHNLLRKTMAQAAAGPREVTAAIELRGRPGCRGYLLGSCELGQARGTHRLGRAQFRVIAWHQVGDRPNRVEPRAIKRHPKLHRWLREPRDQARAALCGRSPAKRACGAEDGSLPEKTVAANHHSLCVETH